MLRNSTSARLYLRAGSLLLLFTLLSMLSFSALPARAQSGWEVVADGLNNPRGLAFSPDGALYVAEAGTGDPENCITPDPTNPSDEICVGTTGSVTRILNGTQERVGTGFTSLAGPDGFGASGPVDISFQGRGGGYVIVGLGADPSVRDFIAQQEPLVANLGWLAKMPASGNWMNQVDVAFYEADNNPDHGEIDSNPYAVLALPSKQIVADAGGNDLLQVNTNGSISTLAVFSPHMWEVPPGLPFPDPPPGAVVPIDPVPTSIIQGPDGAYYVGELASVTTGEANVYRIPQGGVPEGTEPEVYETGFTAIIDIAFAPDGSLYVLEIFKNGLLAGEIFGDLTGALIHVAQDGTRTEIASEGLVAPGGLAVGADGALYVSNYSIFPGMGEVVRIDPNMAASAMSNSAEASTASTAKSLGKLFDLGLNHLRSLVFDNQVFLPNIPR